MGKFILLHWKDTGESVLVNADSIAKVENDPDSNGSILFSKWRDGNRLYVRETIAHIYALAKEE